MTMGRFERFRAWLFGTRPQAFDRRFEGSRGIATGLIHRIAHGGLRGLPDAELMHVVDAVLSNPELRAGLYGNTRFLMSVARQWTRRRTISARQRQGLLNVLERAYPHNLAALLQRM